MSNIESGTPLPEGVEMPNQPLFENEEMKKKFERAQQGEYDHTLLEMWENQLSDELQGYAGQATLDTYESFLRSWPWLNYSDVPKVRQILADFTNEQMGALDEVIEGGLKDDQTKEALFKENEGDWLKHRAFYVEAVVQWTVLANEWGDQWVEASDELKPLIHSAIAIASARVLSPQNGLLEQMKQLKDFEFTEEEATTMNERIKELLGLGDE